MVQTIIIIFTQFLFLSRGDQNGGDAQTAQIATLDTSRCKDIREDRIWGGEKPHIGIRTGENIKRADTRRPKIHQTEKGQQGKVIPNSRIQHLGKQRQEGQEEDETTS